MPALLLDPVLRHLRRVADPRASDADLLTRFVLYQDESAFTALVQRHGPLVQRVCRRMLHDEHAAEDAFQATFFLLARKAGSLTNPELLGSWLHGVACRIALRARVELARRRLKERHVPTCEAVAPDDSFAWREVRGVIDEELSRLPERYRVPLVLCYLEGQTNAEAAKRLGCSRGTVATRLARGRDRLRRGLTRRGLALPATGLALLTSGSQATSAALVDVTVQAAIAFAADPVHVAGPVAAQAVSLAKGVATAMAYHKVKQGAVVLVSMLALLGAGSGWMSYRAEAEQPRAVEVKTVRREEPTAARKDKYQTDNFEIVAPSQDIARQVGQAAEERRKALALLWLGREMPTWSERCPIQVRITNGGTGSVTTFTFHEGKVLSQRMELEGALETVLTDLVPHEVMHAILAHHFGKPIPRWADEGAALLCETAGSGARHERALQKVFQEGRMIRLRQLLPMREYPQDVVVLYTQGHSLTEWLVRARGRSAFLEFVALGDRDGWEKAVKALYKYESVDEMEKAWLASVRDDVVGAKAVPPRGPRGELPRGPAPAQALVELAKDDTLSVWTVGQMYATTYQYEALPNRGSQGSTVIPVSRPVRTVRPITYKLDDVKVYDTKGKIVESAEVRKRLRGETLVLIWITGDPVDPLHLRLVKEDTLALVLPRGTAVPMPPPAPSMPVRE